MKTTNLGEADGLPTIEWSQVETQLADLLTHDDPRSPNRSTFWLTTLNADGSPHVTSVGALGTGLMLVPDRRTHPQGEERCTRPALHDQCRHERLRRDGRRRSPARDRPDDRGRDRGVVGGERMAGAARRLGNRHHGTVQRTDARTAAVVRLRGQAAHRNRSRYRRRDAGFDALAVLKRRRDLNTFCTTKP